MLSDGQGEVGAKGGQSADNVKYSKDQGCRARY